MLISRSKIILSCLGILFLVPLFRADAATEGLFLFDGLRQRVDFEYRYRGLSLREDGDGTTRSDRHRFEEAYRLDINYALRGPNLLFGGAGIEARLDQTSTSTSGATSNQDSNTGGYRLLYDIFGTFLRYKPVSLRFYSNTKMNYVTREFAENYDQEIYTNGLGLHARNKMIPFDVEYRLTEAETDGLVNDYRRKNKTLMISARHHVARFSQTALTIRKDDYRTRYESDLDDYEFLSSRLLLTNDLTWYSGTNSRRLASRMNYVEEEGTEDLHGYDWSENLDWHFGRALVGRLFYNQNYTDRELNDLRRKQGRASLQHKFLDCIDSEIGLEMLDLRQGDGTERERSGDISVAYRKKLSPDSYLHSYVYKRYGEVDREFDSFQRTVFDEAHTANLVIPITLDQLDVVWQSIVVRNADPDERAEPYVSGVDYQVDQVGLTTLVSVLPGSDIAQGTALLIDYNYIGDTQGKYEFHNNRISVSLGFRTSYRAYARWEELKRRHVSGEQQFATSNSDLRELVLGVEGSRKRSSFGLEYRHRKAYYEKRQSVEGFYQWAQRFKKGLLSTGLGNYYARIDPDQGGESYWSNTFNINSRYQSPVFRKGVLALLGKYANTRSNARDRDDVTLGLDYRHGYGKFMLTFAARVDWRFMDSQTRREETVNLKLTRHF